MAVFRIKKENNYTVVSNAILKDKRLSLKSIGLLVVMLGLPEEWDYTIKGLTKIVKDGESAIRASLIELEECGYLVRERTRGENGKFSDIEYVIYETPQRVKPQQESPHVENPHVDKPLVEKRAQLNKKELSTKELNKKELKNNTPSKKSENELIEEMLDAKANDEEELKLLYDWIKNRKKKRAPHTIGAIESNLKDLDSVARESGLSRKEYLQEVIKRGWAAFYPINEYRTTAKKSTTYNYEGGESI